MLIFGQELQGYQNLRDSSYSLLLSLMGDINLESLEEVNAFWGPTFVILFTLVATFIVLNIFIAIVTEGYEDVRDELARSKRYNLREEFGWYICDRLLRIPKYGKMLDHYARFYFSTIRFRRRVNMQRAKLTRMLQRQGVTLSEAGTNASVSGLDVYGTDNDDDSSECISSTFRFCGRACPGGRCPAMCGVQEEQKTSVHATLPNINQSYKYGRYGCKLLQQAYPEHFTDTPLRRARVDEKAGEELNEDGLPSAAPSDQLKSSAAGFQAPAGILVGGTLGGGPFVDTTGSGSSSKRVSIVAGEDLGGEQGGNDETQPPRRAVMSTSGSLYNSDEIETFEDESPVSSPTAVVVSAAPAAAPAPDAVPATAIAHIEAGRAAHAADYTTTAAAAADSDS